MSDFNNSWLFSVDLWKITQTSFVKAHRVAEELFYTYTQRKSRQEHRCQNSVPKFLVRYNEIWIFCRDFRKFNKYFSISCLVRRDRQGGGRTLWIELDNCVTTLQNVLHIYIRSGKYLVILQTVEPISNYFLSGQHSYTRVQLADINALRSTSPNFE
jgi:hypothetical protein